ncbi:MAG: topoisomerase I, DNA topoisomerase I protein [candidate division Kazan bacterium GW2011_GWA1_50_15]|uniref:DNA topoisomerase 1 n=2 Tax=Bacteria division Kazan-3B-28 TaxID=1798534 RepID=A0A0G1ZFZ2_UNCK3|nr:MAG: topoisomerase I, DNA topoisomerase I protein [candidate division Kazan bacterium GW2011_GWA1_50_15]KKW25511.1 MAG: topoisomerase protein [candidate division Kazan bacterium GW2011_GWC1_52_13]KKW26817.1 MAG: topoisomerase protein [candidate division Kazan bacterium GW2011_GWB1_52_7]HAV65809.1 type I DNA topoisomerase [Patescibacteria group bacterium]HCR42780.1 type I DNA topoisomerase [Patescibacteria group bacterium]
MAKDLVVVESPAKARTIEKILGKDYVVEASFGHVRDLPQSKLGVDVEHDFEPQYITPTKSRKTITKLKDLFSKAKMLYLATDEDREGEAIAWHIKEALKAPSAQIKRVAFHEITPEAVKAAFLRPRQLDQNLVDAQQARRIVDRLVGYKLSPLLWKKLYRGLSAGRVQSVALRLLVEREREIQAFKPEEFWKIEVKFKTPTGDGFSAWVFAEKDKEVEIKTEAGAKRLQVAVEAAKQHQVASLTSAERKRYPAPPFTTSTLQQQAGTQLGFTVKRTMMVAQQLYEGINLDGHHGHVGLITYMRTDSTNLAISAVDTARGVIANMFGKEYLPEHPIFYKTKSKGAQEAHEAIRPTHPESTPEMLQDKLTPEQWKLYKLVWQRMMGSQMLPAIINTQEAIVESGEVRSKALGATVVFPGFAKIFDKWPFQENQLPKLTEQELLRLLGVDPTQHFTEPPARYTEASLVKQLEQMGIGRPSTYAPTISTLGVRGYVKREKRSLVPQELGMTVNDFLVEHFSGIVDYNFTAEMENDLDDIAEGKKEWVPVVRHFYEPFEKQIKLKEETVEKQTPADVQTDKKCALCGSPLIIKTSRFGKFLACSAFPKCRYTEALDGNGKSQTEPTDKICPECGAPLVKKRGRFGEFLGCSNYPKCKHIENLEPKASDMDCPKCHEGKVVERRTKRGKIFWGCSKYPKCDFASWEEPLKEPCPTCRGLMTKPAKKGYPVCTQCGFEDKAVV